LNGTANHPSSAKVSRFIQEERGEWNDLPAMTNTLESRTLPASRRVEQYDLVVIGGGQAGLAAGYWLQKQDLDFLIVDAGARVGDVWRNRWDSLQLFTPAKYSGLPGLPFPGDPYHLPKRDAVADYLEWYADVFALPTRMGTRVQSVSRDDNAFRIATSGSTLVADNVIIATGPFQTPRVPAFAKQLDPAIVQLHSSQYKGPGQLPDGDVLVVGAGNSGAQIALELAQTRNTVLAGRAVGSMPRRVLGRDVFDWLYLTVMRPSGDSLLGRRIRKNILNGTDALIGMTERDLERGGVRRTGRVVGVVDGKPRLDTGEVLDVAAIVWSTGFSPDFSWIDAAIMDGKGYPVHKRGVTSVPGLYVLGQRFLNKLNSSLIGGVGADAQYIAGHLAARYGDTRSVTAPARFSGRLETARM
jgi:putative flavoprotein involved in K+ transport